MAAVTAVNELTVPSTSIKVNVPVAVGVPGVALARPPASVTAPVVVPLITATSLVPVMVTVMTRGVPSAAVTVKVSVKVAAAARACTVEFVLLRV